MSATKRRLPDHLHAAYNWTDAAGEINELRTLEGEALTEYCRESAENNASEGEPSGEISEEVLASLAAWLRETGEPVAACGCVPGLCACASRQYCHCTPGTCPCRECLS